MKKRIAITAIFACLAVTVMKADDVKYPRVQVIEDCTGTWCGWCVHAIVAMDSLRQKYPDSFIGIAVHGQDAYEVEGYQPLRNRIQGYPGAFVNRTYCQTKPAEMETAFLYQAKTADCQIRIDEARFTDATRSTLRITTNTVFGKAVTAGKYRVALVLLEDSILDTQKNYYAGSQMGQMGGFESLPNECQIYLMDVARDVTTYYGIENSLPTAMDAGRDYTFEYDYPMPATIQDMGHVSVVAMIVNEKGGRIFNATKCSNLLDYDATPAADGVSAVSTVGSRPVVYTVSGTQQRHPTAGISIVRDTDGQVRKAIRK